MYLVLTQFTSIPSTQVLARSQVPIMLDLGIWHSLLASIYTYTHGCTCAHVRACTHTHTHTHTHTTIFKYFLNGNIQFCEYSLKDFWGLFGIYLSLRTMSPWWEAHHREPSMAHHPGEPPVNRATYNPSVSQLPSLGWFSLLSFQLENTPKTPVPPFQGTVPLPALTTLTSTPSPSPRWWY